MTDYTITKSARAKILRISIHSDASVNVTLPYRMNMKYAEKFIEEKEDWIKESVRKMKIRIAKTPVSLIPKGNKKDMLENKETAELLVMESLAHFNQTYDFKWNTVSIKNTKSRWGSCSGKGNLNFNYRIVYLPKALAEYLIVHEMCHLEQMNHSNKFWELVERAIPDYKDVRRQLKRI